jgi:hypothetical protein
MVVLTVLGIGAAALSGPASAATTAWAATGRMAASTTPAGAARPSASGRTAAAKPLATTGVTTGPDRVTLLAQSPWVSDRQAFHLRLQVTARDPAHEQLRVLVYTRLTSRSAFDQALSGQIDGYQVYPLSLSLSDLPADPAGGVDVDIPVNERATNPAIPTFYAVAGSGVFPVQIGLYSEAGTSQGTALTTYLVYAEPASESGLPKLAVSVTVPVSAAPAVDGRGQTTGLDTATSGALADLVDTLGGHSDVPLSLAVTPQTLDTMAIRSASVLDHSVLAGLTALGQGGHVEVLPQT